MKKIFVLFFVVLSFTSCDEIRHRELYEKTDHFVENLHSIYSSYGLLGGGRYAEYAENGKYKIEPVGRLINVRIEEYFTSRDEYEDLRKSLERHYSRDSRVNSVYICGAGTVMIDCRN